MGVELGKVLAKKVVSALGAAAAKKPLSTEKFNPATAHLL